MGDLAVKRRDASEMTQDESRVLSGVAQQVTQLSDVITCLRTELKKDLPIQHIALLLAVIQQPGRQHCVIDLRRGLRAARMQRKKEEQKPSEAGQAARGNQTERHFPTRRRAISHF